MSLNDALTLEINELNEKCLYRQRIMASTFEPCINFSSNDYLSLRNDARVSRAFVRGFSQFPTGSGASMVVCGSHAIHRELEQTLAKKFGSDDALLFNSGYAANLGVVSLLSRLNAHLLIDKCVHASIYDGIKLSNATHSRFLPNSLIDLEKKIMTVGRNVAVVTEGIFSMSGQQPDLKKMMAICTSYESTLIVDEAHSFGVIGSEGLGAVALAGLTQEQVPLRIVMFGKALGAQGAVVIGKKAWIEGLYQFARSHLYSTAMSPGLAYGLLESLDSVFQADDRRRKLAELVRYFRECIHQSALKWTNSDTPIQQLLLGCPHKAITYADALRRQGIMCLPMRQPTVSLSATGLRVVLNYHHEPSDIDQLFHQLAVCNDD